MNLNQQLRVCQSQSAMGGRQVALNPVSHGGRQVTLNPVSHGLPPGGSESS